MRRGRRSVAAVTVLCLGLVILFSVMLPGVFWWLLLSGALIALGIWLLRCC